jgi:hypothetical protein
MRRLARHRKLHYGACDHGRLQQVEGYRAEGGT